MPTRAYGIIMKGLNGAPYDNDGHVKSPESVRIQQHIESVAAQADAHPCLTSALNRLAPAGRLAVSTMCLLAPLVQLCVTIVRLVYAVTPTSLIKCIFGAFLCLFGGPYVASLAAIEAFRTFGGVRMYEAVATVCAQAASATELLGGEAPLLLGAAELLEQLTELGVLAIRKE